METVIRKFEKNYLKPQVADVRSGDTVRVHQRIIESGKERTQVFEGVVIRTNRQNSLTASITVRRVASGIGVEKSFLLHSPTVEKIDIVRRSKVRRNYLSYLRARQGKSARLQEIAYTQVDEPLESAPTVDETATKNNPSDTAETPSKPTKTTKSKTAQTKKDKSAKS